MVPPREVWPMAFDKAVKEDALVAAARHPVSGRQVRSVVAASEARLARHHRQDSCEGTSGRVRPGGA